MLWYDSHGAMIRKNWKVLPQKSTHAENAWKRLVSANFHICIMKAWRKKGTLRLRYYHLLEESNRPF